MRAWPLARLAFWLLPPLIALALYAPALSLPYYWDDMTVFRYMQGRTVALMWTDASGFPFYRPFTHTAFRLIELIVGATNVAAFRGINVLLLVMGGWLTGRLAAELAARDSDWLGAVTAALLVVFPFHAQTAPAVNNLYHFIALVSVVGAGVCLLRFAQARQWGWAAGALALAFIAPFSQEAGITCGALMALCYAFYAWQCGELRQDRKHLLPLLIIVGAFLADLLFLYLWATVPKSRNPGDTPFAGLGAMPYNANFFLQGLTLPLQFLARPLMQIGVEDVWAVFIIGLAALALAFAVSGDRRWVLFGLLYGFAAAGPAIVVLQYAYVLSSIRLTTFVSPAPAMLWAAVIVTGVQRLTQVAAPVRAAIVAVSAVGLSLVPAYFVVDAIRFHHFVVDHHWDIVHDVESHPDESLLIVNAVDWISPTRFIYALGHTGVLSVPGYTDVRSMVWMHTGREFDIQTVSTPVIAPDLKTLYFNTLGEKLDWAPLAERIRAVDRVAVIHYSDSGIEYRVVGSVQRGAAAVNPPVATFADAISLLSISTTGGAARAQATLVWQAEGSLSADIFSNVADCAGNPLGLSSGASLGGLYPVWLWQAGETITDIRTIPLDSPSTDGCYLLFVGLFDPATMARFPAQDAAGRPILDDVIITDFAAP